MATARLTTVLPEGVRRFFWDVDAAAIAWPEQRDFIITRLLRSGDWSSIQWLRERVTAEELASWLRAHRGGGLSLQRLRYWQLILDLPRADVDAWVAEHKAESWAARSRR